MDARFDESLSGQNDGKMKRDNGAEFMKRVGPKSMLEAFSSIFAVPFYSNRKG